MFGNGGESRLRDAGRLTALLGPGLGLAILLRFHPAVGDAAYDTLAPVAESWLTLHLLLLLSFGLLGLSLSLLLQGCSGPVATVGRVGVGVYLVFYIAFESIAGVATGVLVRTGEGLPAEQEAGIREAVAVIYAEPVGGFAGLFAVVGFVGYVVAVVAIAVAKRRDGAPAAPLVLLVGSSVGIIAHGSSPVDSLGILLFPIAAGWLEAATASNRESVA